MHYIFHIGPHKTGSSALQQLLQLNGDRLKNHGILLPQSGRIAGRCAWHYLAWGCRNPPAARFDAEVSVETMLADVRIEAEAGGAKKVVISSEAFTSFDAAPDRLRKVLGVQRATVLFWLRRSDALLNSWYNHHVRSGKNEHRTIEQFVAASHVTSLATRRADLLAPWADVFGGKIFGCWCWTKGNPRKKYMGSFLRA